MGKERRMQCEFCGRAFTGFERRPVTASSTVPGVESIEMLLERDLAAWKLAKEAVERARRPR